MEDLAPTYLFVLHLIDELGAGHPARAAARQHARESRGDLQQQLLAWLVSSEHGRPESFEAVKREMSPARRHVFEVLDLAGRGISILPTLQELEAELRQLSRQQLDEHLAKLPFKMMLPLLLCQFPALLLLILGPLLWNLLKEVG